MRHAIQALAITAGFVACVYAVTAYTLAKALDIHYR